MNRLVILLFGIVSTVAVSILLILLYRYANKSDEMVYLAQKNEPRFFKERSKTTDSTQKWLKDLATRKKPSFSYAVSEMEISLPLKKSPKPKTSIRMTMENLDNYKRFCIKQTLERDGIDFAIYRNGSKTVVMIHNIDKEKQERIGRMVQKYDIKTKIEKYVKD